MATDHAEVLLRKSQDPPLGGSVRDCRSSGLKGKKSGPFTLLVLMIGAVFRMLPQNSRKIERAKKIVFRRANWGIGIIRTHVWMPQTVGLEICFFLTCPINFRETMF